MTALAKLERQPYGANKSKIWIHDKITDKDGKERQIYDYEIDEYDPLVAAGDEIYYKKPRHMIYLTPEDHNLVQADPKLKKEYMMILHNDNRLTKAEQVKGVKKGKGMYLYVRLSTPEYLVDNAKPKDKIENLTVEKYNSLDDEYKPKVFVYGMDYYKVWPKRTPEELVEEINGLKTMYGNILLTTDEFMSLGKDVQNRLGISGGIYYKKPSAEEQATAANIVKEKYDAEQKKMLQKKMIENDVKELTEYEYNLIDEGDKQLFEAKYSYDYGNVANIEKYVRKEFGPANNKLTHAEKKAEDIDEIVRKINNGEPQRLNSRDYIKLLPEEYRNDVYFIKDPNQINKINPDYISIYKTNQNGGGSR